MVYAWIFLIVFGYSTILNTIQKKEMSVTIDELADKIKGGWAGKTIGCT